MNGWDILILVAVAAMVFFAARTWRRSAGRSGSCCGGCDACRGCAGGQGGKPCRCDRSGDEKGGPSA